MRVLPCKYDSARKRKEKKKLRLPQVYCKERGVLLCFEMKEASFYLQYCKRMRRHGASATLYVQEYKSLPLVYCNQGFLLYTLQGHPGT